MVLLHSSAREVRSPLPDERGGAFGVVGGIPELTLEIPLDIELLRERARTGAVDCVLRACKSASRCRGELSRELVDCCSQVGIFDTAPDHSPGRSLFGTQLVAEKSETHGARR